jgi:hypothetical protein
MSEASVIDNIISTFIESVLKTNLRLFLCSKLRSHDVLLNEFVCKFKLFLLKKDFMADEGNWCLIESDPGKLHHPLVESFI